MQKQSGDKMKSQTMITSFFKRNSEDDVRKSKKRGRIDIELDANEYECQNIIVSGVNIAFPGSFDPYPSQSDIIKKNIFSFDESKHVLIESPTGSGKTMALLSSAIGWLKHYKDKVRMSEKNCKKHGSMVNILNKENDGEILKEEVKNEESNCSAEGYINNNDNVKSECIKNEDDNLDLCTCMGKIQIYYATRTHKQIAQVIKELKRLPYCYKNNKNINNIHHTILSAREHTCINPEVKQSSNITERCKEIDLEYRTKCKFKSRLNKKFDELKRDFFVKQIPPVWDVEELVEYGTLNRLCPYFAATTHLRKEADVIFCPFNYIIDPIIRDTANISVENSIVILDEAHNIESFCRSSSSFSFTEKEIIHSLNDIHLRRNFLRRHIEKCTSKDVKEEEYDIDVGDSENVEYLSECLKQMEYLFTFMGTLLSWFKSFSLEVLKEKPSNDGIQSRVFRTSEIMRSLVNSKLSVYKIDQLELGKLKRAWICCSSIGDGEENDISNNRNDYDKKLRKFKINTLCAVCIEKFIYFIRFLVKSPNAYRVFYSIEKSKFNFDIFNFSNRNISKFSDSSVIYTDAGYKKDIKGDEESYRNFIGGKKYEQIKENCIVKLDIWCLDPSLCFDDAFHNVHSIVLASGTLSPIDTFTSELRKKFESIVQGDQIIPREQIFASVISVGPNNRDIVCTKNEISAGEQRNGISVLLEIASLIVDVCENVDKGVLIFFPSYSMLEQVVRKLNVSRLMLRLKDVKLVLQEPRRSSDLDEIMSKYQEAIKHPELTSKSCTGSVLFAVFRGKFSEGIDFADDLARCVISIGIPYPNIGDPQVKEKREFNDKFCKQRNLLSGEEWYKIEAYRALNQALGRCLRHRNDWGLILMVDKRLYRIFEDNSDDKNKMSKWVVDNMKSYNNYETFRKQMRTFVDERKNLSIPVKKEDI
uniref:DNA helicase n=1 Tax=Strongyloides venezuelensis TaxID=75913 RepID=A0A0K0FDK6_STRVS